MQTYHPSYSRKPKVGESHSRPAWVKIEIISSKKKNQSKKGLEAWFTL
jgi:hypothetical protein